MENYEELMDLTSDIRYGDVMVLYNKQNPKDKIIKKTLTFPSPETLKNALSSLEARKKKNHTNLINFLEIQEDHENLKIVTYHEFIDEFFDLKKTDIQELIIMFKDILKGLRVINSLKKIHGDLRPDFIAFDPMSKNYILIDRFRNEVDFYDCQIRNIDDYKDLFISERLFDSILISERNCGYSIEDEIFSLGFICLGFFFDKGKLQDLYDFEKGKFDRKKFEEIFEEVNQKNESILEKSFLTFLKNNVFGKDRSEIGVAFSALKNVEEFKNLFSYDYEMEINQEDEKNLKNVKTYEILNIEDTSSHKKKISNQKVNLQQQKNKELDKLEKYLGSIENKNLKQKIENTEKINFERTQNNLKSEPSINEQSLIDPFIPDLEDELEPIKFLKIKMEKPFYKEPFEKEDKDFYNDLSESIDLENNEENSNKIESKNLENNKNKKKKNLSTFLRDTVKLERESKRQNEFVIKNIPVVIVNQKKKIETEKIISDNTVLKKKKKEMNLKNYNILNIKKKKTKSRKRLDKKKLKMRKSKAKKKKLNPEEKERISKRITSLQNLEKKLESYHIKNKERITNRSKSRTTNKNNKKISQNEYGITNKSQTVNYKNNSTNILQNEKLNEYNINNHNKNKKSLNSEYYKKNKNKTSFENLSKNLLSHISYINYPEKKIKNTNHFSHAKNPINKQKKIRSSNFIDCYTPNFLQNHIQKKIVQTNNLQSHQIYNQKNIAERESLQQNLKNGKSVRTSQNSYNSIYSQTLNKNIHLYKTPQKMFSTNNSNRSNLNDYQSAQNNKRVNSSVNSGSKGSTLWINSPFENNRKSQKSYNIYRNQHNYHKSNDYGYGA